MLRSFLLFAGILIALPHFSIGQNRARPIVNASIAAMKACTSAFGRINRSERINGEMVKGDLIFKMQTNPYKVYIYNVLPDEGAEVLFSKGWNNDKVYIHPNKFPYVNVSFDPHSSMLLKDRHHSIFDVGFVYTLRVVEHVMEKYSEDFDKYVTWEKEVVWEGKTCDVITINYPDYTFEDYTVQAGENVIDIDQKLRVPAYKILELNPDVKDFFDIKEGQVIKVPNVYAQKVVFFIDRVDHLPVVQIVYDEKGLFERYEYVKVDYNRPFKPEEFRPEWEEYNFKN